MLLPRYSLRTTLIAVTLCAVFFLILGLAVRGRPWAIVISVAVVSVLATLAIHACFFLLTSILARYVGTQRIRVRTSQGGLQTSADDQLPPSTPGVSGDG